MVRLSLLTCRKRAKTTIEDFALTYFPYHGLKLPEVSRYLAPACRHAFLILFCVIPRTCLSSTEAWLSALLHAVDRLFVSLEIQCLQEFFKYLDILVFVEATIYAVDEANERLARLGMNPKHAHTEGELVHLHRSPMLQILLAPNQMHTKVSSRKQS